MRTLFLLAAVCSAPAALAAQQSTSADPSYVPGLAPGYAPVAIGARATTACDDFNRTALGPDWTPLGGTPTIVADAYADATGGNSYAQHATASVAVGSAVIAVDVTDFPTNGSYGAAVHGLGGATNTYTKLQSNGGGQYDFIGFYSGFNGPSYGSGFTSIAPVSGGIATMYLTNSDDTMNVDIDTDRDGVVDVSYNTSGASAYTASAGMGVGIGSWGGFNSAPTFGSVDSWELNSGCGPVGPSLALLGSCPGLVGVDIGGMTPGQNVAIVAGIAGAFPIPAGRPCAGTDIGVNPLAIPQGPIFFVVPADGNGEVNIGAVGNAGAGACGTISVVAIDLSTCAVSNVAAL